MSRFILYLFQYNLTGADGRDGRGGEVPPLYPYTYPIIYYYITTKIKKKINKIGRDKTKRNFIKSQYHLSLRSNDTVLNSSNHNITSPLPNIILMIIIIKSIIIFYPFVS